MSDATFGGSTRAVLDGARRAGRVVVPLAFALLMSACSASSSGTSGESATTSGSSHSAAASSGKTTGKKPDLLSIPTIDFTSGLEPEGLRGGQVNPRPGEVIWFTGSARVAPGERGTAVVAGHVANGTKPDVFARLDEVKVGSTFALTMNDGSTVRFTVKRAEVVDKQALRHDQQVWGRNTTTRRVAIVTCDDELGFGADGHRKANYVVVGEAAA